MKKNYIFFDVCLSFGHVKPLVVVTCPVLADPSLSPPPLIEGALVFFSLWCYSVWGVKHFARLLLCLTSPEEMVLIVRQGGPNCPTRWF